MLSGSSVYICVWIDIGDEHLLWKVMKVYSLSFLEFKGNGMLKRGQRGDFMLWRVFLLASHCLC